MIFGNFVYLQAVKGVDAISYPVKTNVNKLKICRNALNLSLLRSALRKNIMPRGRFACI